MSFLINLYNQRNLVKYQSLIETINEFESNLYRELPVHEIKNKLLIIKHDRSMKDKTKILHAMALAKKAAKYTLNMAYYDVQLMGALALFDGCIAEMKTGEGKTLTCSAAVAGNYVLGFQTHVATANEYLAKRDQETLEPLYSFLGISSSHNLSTMDKDSKRLAYQADVVYSTAQEFGFDFLKDNLVDSLHLKCQPKNLNTIKAIIDEADFILIDEARTPLIISGEAKIQNNNTYVVIRNIALHLQKMAKAPEISPLLVQEHIPGDFWTDDKSKNVHLSESGYQKIEELCIDNNLIQNYKNKSSLYQPENSWIIHEVINALKAQYCYILDKDYVVKDNEIIIIDQHTGRLAKGRNWSNGLHQAVEAKENVLINAETVNIGSISIQNYFKNYLQISGMSGTIMTSSEEFQEIYGVTTIRIPTNKPMIRKDHDDRIYLNLNAKYKAIINDIKVRNKRGQPILIGTTSVAESEKISELLKEEKIKHHVLNAKNHFLEAQIIAQAGQPYSVTVSTSMAGRGTDIILGGNKESLISILEQQLNEITERKNFFEMLFSSTENQEDIVLNNEILQKDFSHIDHNDVQEHLSNFRDHIYLNEMFAKGKEYVFHLVHILEETVKKQILLINNEQENWRKLVLDCGGLYVLGSSRNESRRIDDQLRGRSGRQGDPGESCFYLSIEDPWVNVFGQNKIFSRMTQNIVTDDPISSPILNKAFARAQESIESFHFGARKDTFQYDTAADEGRKHFLMARDNCLSGTNMVKEVVLSTLRDVYYPISEEDFYRYVEYSEVIENTLSSDFESQLELTKHICSFPYQDVKKIVHSYIKEIESKRKKIDKPSKDYCEHKCQEIFNQLTEEDWENLRFNAIKNMDEKWTNHLIFIDDARQNVALRTILAKNPLYEFKEICFESFKMLLNDIRYSITEDFINLINLKVTEQ